MSDEVKLLPCRDDMWFDKAIRAHCAEHGPAGDAWNISMILERLHSSRPPIGTDEVVERVARAIVDEFTRNSPTAAADLDMDPKAWEPEALAAIAAMKDAASDGGA